MTDDQGLMLWTRLKSVFGEPRASGEATGDLWEEWWQSIGKLDYTLANQAVTRMRDEREYKNFPTPGEFRRYYQFEVGPRSTVDDGQRVNDTERYYNQARRLPAAEYAELKERAKTEAAEWCRAWNMEGLEKLRTVFEIARIYAWNRNLKFYGAISEDDIPF